MSQQGLQLTTETKRRERTNALIDRLYTEGRGEDACGLDEETAEVSLRVDRMIQRLEAVL